MFEKIEKSLSNIIYSFPGKKNILFESVPDFSDNALPVFIEMVNRNINNKYKFVWQIYDKSFDVSVFGKYKNVSYEYVNYDSLIWKIKHYFVASKTKLVLGCNHFIKLYFDSQRYLHLSHGCALKRTNYYTLKSYVDNALTVSDALAKYDAINFNCDINKLLPLGFPRNDYLYNKIETNLLFNDKSFNKIVYWLPTFRQHKSANAKHSSISFPIIHSDKDANEINAVCAENKVLLVIKPHPMQDLTNIKMLSLSNLVFIDNTFFVENNIQHYEFLGNTDALITDYSSVIYDYLLCNKPIGLCFEDFDEYKNTVGFVDIYKRVFSSGEKLYNADDLKSFIKAVSDENDKLYNQRNEVKKFIHKYDDNNSTKRVVDYIASNYL